MRWSTCTQEATVTLEVEIVLGGIGDIPIYNGTCKTVA